MKNPKKSSEKPKIVVILGPTSAGKSAVAIQLAQEFNGEVVSVDSRQIYRGMDLGTGKVIRDQNPKHEILNSKQIINSKFKKNKPYISEGIIHHMLDIASPRTNFSAAQFKKKADKIIKDILKQGKLPILCGGTGFWIKSIVNNITYPEVKPDPELRRRLEIESAENLFIQLKKLDPERAKNIDAKNKVRLIRAIEICQTLGQVPTTKADPQYDVLQIGLDVPKEKLHAKIKKRLDQRWKDGMLEEVKFLRKKYKLSWKKIQSFGLGYFWIPEYLQNKIALDELYEKVFLAEKDYAKRQMTWFSAQGRSVSGGQKKIVWLEKYPNIQKEITSFTKKQD